MATAPEVEEPTPSPVQRVRAAIATPASDKHRAVTLLAISAALVSLAPVPFGAIGAAALVLVAADSRRR